MLFYFYIIIKIKSSYLEASLISTTFSIFIDSRTVRIISFPSARFYLIFSESFWSSSASSGNLISCLVDPCLSINVKYPSASTSIAVNWDLLIFGTLTVWEVGIESSYFFPLKISIPVIFVLRDRVFRFWRWCVRLLYMIYCLQIPCMNLF